MHSLFPIATLAVALTLPGVALAEATFSGDLSMGLRFDGEKVQAVSSAKLTAKFSGQTDGGLDYGAVIRLDPATALQTKACTFPFNPVCNTGTDRPGGYVYISGGNSTLAIGQTNSAAHEVIGTVPQPGF